MGEIDPDRPMYRWRKMTPAERQATLEHRRRNRLPWHAPPHYVDDSGLYMISASCFEHRPVIGHTPERMTLFETQLLKTAHSGSTKIFAWNALPNHYHVLFHSLGVRELLKRLGQLHGRTSFFWNGEEGRRGRQVWFNAAETAMKSEGHFWATFNYVLNNAVHHRYVARWQDWPYSNAEQYLADVGREEAERRWREYPVLDYGEDWDPPEL
jgi:putative transposase